MTDAGTPEPDAPDAPDSPDADDASVIDARGQRCPMPVIRLARAARDDPTPRRITVLATDPAAEHDIPAWCRMRGHHYAGARRGDDHTAYDVDLRPTEPAAER